MPTWMLRVPSSAVTTSVLTRPIDTSTAGPTSRRYWSARGGSRSRPGVSSGIARDG